MVCLICEREFDPKRRKHPFCYDCFPVEVYNAHGRRCAMAWKAYAVKRAGGECFKCGYNRCQEALQFHHLDPNKKESSIVNITRSGGLDVKERLDAELDKCVLLCANCHAEEHSQS